MAFVPIPSTYFPPNMRWEHRRAGNRIIVHLPRGEFDNDGNRSHSVSYSPAVVDDSISVNTRTSKISERRAMLKAASWACKWLLDNYEVSDDGTERCEECIGTELSLTPMDSWPAE